MAYDVETILLAVALMTGVVGIVWLSVALRKNIRRGSNLGAMPDELSGEGGLSGDDFAGKRSRLGNDLIRVAAALPAEDRGPTHHALWHAMLLEACADGSVDTREVRFVADFFGRLSGRRLPGDSAIEAADHIAAHPQRALGEIAKARHTAPPSKRCVLESAMLVSLADGEMIESEANRLGEIADALGIGLDDRRTIYSDMTRRLRTRAT